MEKNTIVCKSQLISKFWLLASFLFLFSTTLFAQGQKVKGIILDETGNPAIGVYIQNITTNGGASTGLDGDFEISASVGDVLKMTSLGYATVDMTLNNLNPINITLTPDAQNLEEIVVIGYGTQKKSDVSGSVASVSGEKIANIATGSSAGALAGMATGLNVNYGTGSPGSEPTLQIRGITSWGSDNDPLIIIDGVPGTMDYLNPDDIKSVSVLKDAATAAIYGARAAAGVILIETKRGTKQEPKIQISAFFGLDLLPKKMEMCNAEEFIQVRKWALTNAGVSEDLWPGYIAAYDADPSQFADTDWQDEYYQMGKSQMYNIGYTAGNENSNLAISAYFSDTEGIEVATGSQKYGFRINSDVKKDKFKMGESVSYGRKVWEPSESSGFEAMYQVTNIEPLVSVYDANNECGYGGAVTGMGMSDAGNPVAFNNLIETQYDNDYITASAYVQYEPIKNLIFKFQGAGDLTFSHYKSFTPTYDVGILKTNTTASLSESRSRSNKYLLEFTGNYDVTINNKHNISALIGASQEEYNYYDMDAYGTTFDSNDLYYLGHAQDGYSIGGDYYRYGLQSLFARLSYNYENKYMFMASTRYDGSSRFASGNKWGVFPSLSAAWNVSKEEFWSPLKDAISTFKFRLSYGGLGNQSIGYYQYIATLSSNTNDLNYPFDGYTPSLGYAVTSIPSADIKWETTITKNIGIDLGFLNNKLEFTAEGYIKDTKDMLSEKQISSTTGYSSIIVNDGELRTTGFEVGIVYHGEVGSDFKYDLDLNLSNFKSVLVSMSDEGYTYEYGPAKTYVGGEIGEFWVVETDGIFQNQAEIDAYTHNGELIQPNAAPGDIKFVDQNDDGIIDSEDKVCVGSGNPDLVLGFNAFIAYKGFDLTANFLGNFGVQRYNYTKYQLQRMDQVFNYGKDALNSWRTDNTDTDIPRAVQGDPNDNGRISDRFVENGNYLTLNNLQIGYNIPSNICKKMNIDNLRVYLAGTRLFTITNYSGYDATTGSESGEMGVDYGGCPLYSSFVLGLKFGF